jgi:hypothetical protein
VWTAPIHEKNVERLYNYMREAYGDQSLQAENKAREMVAIRRQLMMYAKIHPTSNIDQRPTQLETAVFVDARISGDTGSYLTALSEFVGKFPEGELNTI